MPIISFAVVLVLLVLLYFKAIRPQQQVLRAQQQVVASLAVGDRVISSAGIFGRITALTEDVAHLEIAPGVVIQVARAAIAHKVELDESDLLGRQLVDLAGSNQTNEATADAPAEGTVDIDHPALRED